MDEKGSAKDLDSLQEPTRVKATKARADRAKVKVAAGVVVAASVAVPAGSGVGQAVLAADLAVLVADREVGAVATFSVLSPIRPFRTNSS